jgi:4-amino-4-deoxy-L-arabinose transferase-like glycosyltransferase
MLGSQDRSWPFPVLYEGDAEAFYDYAQAILRGVPYDNGIPFHPPLFPYLLSGLHALLGMPPPQALIRGILAVASAVVPLLLYRLVHRLVSREAAIAASLLAALSFGLDALGSAATSEGLFLLLCFGLLLLGSTPPAKGRRGFEKAALLGACGAALALTRAEGIVLAVAVPVVWLLRPRGRRSRSRAPRACASPPRR